VKLYYHYLLFQLLCQRYYYCTCSIYCNYIIITSFFSCCARDSIMKKEVMII
jgi:hypothetical protein